MRRTSRVLYISMDIVIVFLAAKTFVGNVLYIQRYLAVDLQKALYSLFSLLAMTIAVYTLFTAFVQRKKIIELFDDFQQIIDASKSRIDTRSSSIEIVTNNSN